MSPVVATYEYRDEDGELLFETVRHEPKGFRQRRPEGKGGWIYNLEGVRRVLYGLPMLRAAIEVDKPLYLCEGEKDAGALIGLGLCATTAPMGAGALWCEDYTCQLAGATQLMILPDNDEPGRRHAEKVALSLTAAGVEVRIVQLPDLPEKGDVSDWLAAGGSREALEHLADRTAVWAPVCPADGKNSNASLGKPSQADRMVTIARQLYEFGVSETGDTFAVSRNGARIATPLRGSKGLRAVLAREHSIRHDKAPSAAALADALQVLEGEALLADPTPVHLRVAMHEDALWVDLCDATGTAVRIDGTGWEPAIPRDVLFRRSELTAPMPFPERGGQFDQIFDFANVHGDARLLVRGWAVSAMFADSQTPILALTGEQGTGKTATARALIDVVDPSNAPLQGPPRDLTTWGLIADATWVTSLDNFSAIASWFADVLCRAVSGDAIVCRTLYTNSEATIWRIRKPVLITGIALGALPGDLVDRTLFVELERIPADRTQLDSQMAREFAAARPRILGGLFDLVSATLRERGRVPVPDDPPRPSDHAHLLAALDQAIGGDHLGAFRRAKASAMEDASRGSALVEAVLRHMAVAPPWRGTPAELYQLLTPAERPPGWPCNEQRLSQELTGVAPMLRARGVGVERQRSNGVRLITLRRAEADHE